MRHNASTSTYSREQYLLMVSRNAILVRYVLICYVTCFQLDDQVLLKFMFMLRESGGIVAYHLAINSKFVNALSWNIARLTSTETDLPIDSLVRSTVFNYIQGPKIWKTMWLSLKLVLKISYASICTSPWSCRKNLPRSVRVCGSTTSTFHVQVKLKQKRYSYLELVHVIMHSGNPSAEFELGCKLLNKILIRHVSSTIYVCPRYPGQNLVPYTSKDTS